MIGLLLRKKQLKQLIKATNLCNCQNWGAVTGVKVRMWKKPYSSASKITELSEDWCQGGIKLVSKHLKNALIEHKSEDWPQMRRYVLSGKSLTKDSSESQEPKCLSQVFMRGTLIQEKFWLKVGITVKQQQLVRIPPPLFLALKDICDRIKQLPWEGYKESCVVKRK